MNICKTVLLFSAFGLFSAFAGDYDSVVDDSVVGYWRFNDPNDYGKDSSGHGSDIMEFRISTTAGGVADSARDGGYLHLQKNGSTYGTAIATANGPRTVDFSSSTRGWTIATWIRGTESIFNLNFIEKGIIALSKDASAFYSALTDGKWHPIVVVFRPNLGSACYRIYVNAFDAKNVTDICSTDDKPGKFPWTFPVSIYETTVTLGGKIAGSGAGYGSLSADFFGDLDDCIIIDRELSGGGQQSDAEKNAGTVRTNDEVFRLVQTGETFVFSKGSSGNMFYEAGNWSNGKVPQPGLAYMIENGHEVKSAKTATFAGKSLSVGRTEKLRGIKSVGGSKEAIVDNTVGKLTQQGADTTLTVDDLRLNDGVLASMADGQSLSANMTVSASSAKPFEINVSTGTYRITGRMTGGGCLVKRGSGTLDLSGLSELDAQIVVEAGAVRLPTAVTGCIDYSGGEIVITHDDEQTQTPVLIHSSTVWPVVCTVEGEFGQVGCHALFAVSNSVKEVVASDFAVTATTALGLEAKVRIEKGDAVQFVLIDVVASDRYTVGLDTFEECSVGDEAADIPGWAGTGSVVASSPAIPTPPSHALDGVEHTKALAVEDAVIRTYANNFERDNQIVDALVEVVKGSLPAPSGEAEGISAGRVAFGVDAEGRFCIYHPDDAGNGVWTPLSFGSKSVFENGEWVRLTVVMDYYSNPSGAAYAQLRVNGSCGIAASGVRSPIDLRAGGSWFRLFDRARSSKKVARLRFNGDVEIDDVMVSGYKRTLKPDTHTGAEIEVGYAGTYGSGKIVSGRIAYGLCDEKGIPRDLHCDSDGDGAADGVELLKGTDPLDPDSFPGDGMMVIIR